MNKTIIEQPRFKHFDFEKGIQNLDNICLKNEQDILFSGPRNHTLSSKTSLTPIS